MNCTIQNSELSSSPSELLDEACNLIAPAWPLDRSIAVNPYWGWINRRFEDTANELATLAGSPMYMPAKWFVDAWERGLVRESHLEEASAELGVSDSPAALLLAVKRGDGKLLSIPLLTDVLDSRRNLSEVPAWNDTITHQVSQFCASHFDSLQSDARRSEEGGLYAAWRSDMRTDLSIRLLMDAPQVSERARSLPKDWNDVASFIFDQLEMKDSLRRDFLRAALFRISGWAGWCAYLRWQARLQGGDDRSLNELLSIRLAWEYLIDDGMRTASSSWARWQEALDRFIRSDGKLKSKSVWLRATELSYQLPLADSLSCFPAKDAPPPSFQAVFCIDVRSEVFRRALESIDPRCQTLGFAGFFGLPISFTPLGTHDSRPQLPGLLAPVLPATETTGLTATDAEVKRMRHTVLREQAQRDPFERLPASAFGMVEALGMGYLRKLFDRAFKAAGQSSSLVDGLPLPRGAELRPQVAFAVDDLTAPADLAERILRAMSLTEGFARLVLLVGHGSQSANNPQAAALDCGACCGQTGEVNARAAAGLLNDSGVRKLLSERGIHIPNSTHFLAGLHNTTTDELALFDTKFVPDSHAPELATLRELLAAAGDRARAERAVRLGLSAESGDSTALFRKLKARANDWSQTRPEWGLVNNASFIVAPRSRTRSLNLEGRAFLHEYVWERDRDGSVLELIMTAPMIVTHWINMQYYASTVDNLRFGSGNKVLHNVVGGRIGVFEGNGGDLRIGLSKQSLHDGSRWVHTPLRLSVFIEAPREAISAVIDQHENVRNLIEHRWMFLFGIDPTSSSVYAYREGAWKPVTTAQHTKP